MTVKEYIEKLSKLPMDSVVVVESEYPDGIESHAFCFELADSPYAGRYVGNLVGQWVRAKPENQDAVDCVVLGAD